MTTEAPAGDRITTEIAKKQLSEIEKNNENHAQRITDFITLFVHTQRAPSMAPASVKILADKRF